MFDPAIAQNDPAMNDLYFEGRPATAITCGPVQLQGYESGLADGKLGMNVYANILTGEIGFEAIGTTPDAGTYVSSMHTCMKRRSQWNYYLAQSACGYSRRF